MVVGASRNNRGLALIYESADLYHWNFLNVLAESRGEWGFMWECPDFYQLGDKYVLTFSPMGSGDHTSVYLTGDFDYKTGKFDWHISGEMDWGFDFYAPQTLEAPDGRRILFGWAGVSDSPYDNEPSIREGWQHSMTVPRELSWKGGILCQKPVRELEALRKDEIVFEQGEAEIHGGAFDLVAERDIAGEIPVCICFNQELQITYGHGVVSMEFLNNTGSGRTIRKAKLDGLQNVRILMDVSLMEVYFNDGELVMTTRYYPEDPMTTKVSISGMEQVKGWTMAGQ